MLFRLFNSKNLFVTHDSEPGRQILAEQFKEAQDDFGSFSYTDTGFDLTQHKEVRHYAWTDIETIFGYKEDLMTTDEICMDLFTKDKGVITLTESTPGWFQFNDKLKEQIPAIPQNWDLDISVPAFETMLTLLFDRSGRTKEEAIAAWYKV